MNHIFKIIFSIFFSIIFSYQTTTLKGVVLDEKNNPINNVYIISETGYTETNYDGNFIILYKDKKEEVTFNKIGYKNEKHSVESLLKKNSIIMKIENIQLEEVKISEISGNIKKEESTSDIHIYSNSDFKPGNIHFDDIIIFFKHNYDHKITI